jgi:hypothetical protein
MWLRNGSAVADLPGQLLPRGINDHERAFMPLEFVERHSHNFVIAPVKARGLLHADFPSLGSVAGFREQQRQAAGQEKQGLPRGGATLKAEAITSRITIRIKKLRSPRVC